MPGAHATTRLAVFMNSDRSFAQSSLRHQSNLYSFIEFYENTGEQ